MPTDRTNQPGQRKRVPNHPGIYVRRDARNRRRFEFTYRDSAGKQRWQTVEGGVTAAEHARQELVAKIRRGERVITSRMTFTEAAALWLRRKANIRESSRRWYEMALRRHVVPHLGRLRVSAISTDDIARLIVQLQNDGLAATTITNILVPTSGVFDYAVRRGILATNPVKGLERDERPRIVREEMRVLDRHEIAALLDAAPNRYRTLLATGIFTGLRASELLGLLWWHIDFSNGVVKVREQVYRTGERLPLKTEKGRRDIVLQPALASLLREHRLASPHSQDDDYVFCRPDGRPVHPDVARKYGLHRAVTDAGLDKPGKPRLRFHDLRHTYASLLIAQGVDVAYVSRQLGHANITTTLNTYTHLFDHARNAELVKERLEREFASILADPGRIHSSQGVAALTPPAA